MKNLLLIGIAGLTLASCKTVSKQYTVRPKSKTLTQGTANFIQKKGNVEMDLKHFFITLALKLLW